MYKLPVFRTIAEGYRFIWGARGDWFNYALGPILLVSLIPALFGYFARSAFGTGFPPEPGMPEPGFDIGIFLGVLAAFVLMIMVYVAFAVAWHRRYLMGSEATSPREMIAWQRRHWVFLGRGALYALLAALVGGLIAIPVAAIVATIAAASDPTGTPGAVIAGALVGNIATMIIVAALLVGPLLAFPAAAVEDYSFRLSTGWAIAKGNRLRMSAILLLGAAVVPFIAQMLVGVFLAGAGFAFFLGVSDAAEPVQLSLTITFVAELISSAVYFLGIATGVSLLSIMYRRMRDNVPLPPARAASPPDAEAA